jgi:hypothetical protein
VKHTRIPISRTIRFAILHRDKFSCQYCGAKAPDVILHIDHVIPVAQGGKNETGNLVTACFDCNMGKRDKMVRHVPAVSAEFIAQLAAEQAELEAEWRRDMEAEAKREREADEEADALAKHDPDEDTLRFLNAEFIRRYPVKYRDIAATMPSKRTIPMAEHIVLWHAAAFDSFSEVM